MLAAVSSNFKDQMAVPINLLQVKRAVMRSLIALHLLLFTSPVLCLISPSVTSSSTSKSADVCVARTMTSISSSTTHEETTIVDRSTLTLLEHVNLNVPNHSYIIDFYFGLLGCGVDPRRAANLMRGTNTVWANCGASQFHLPHGETPQVIPGVIGLKYDSLEELKQRLNSHDYKECYESSTELADGGIQIVDKYGNVFVCREKQTPTMTTMKQPLVSKQDTNEFGTVATKYGCDETECRGIDYVEIKCPQNTADKIALFYDSVLDATTFVVEHNNSKVAIIAFGNVDENGRPSQSLLFRETSEVIPRYDGHHLAMYVGTNAADFEQAFKNANTVGIVWVNPRFSDNVMSLDGAREWKQFRFKNIVEMETGETILELEHEIRSIEHSAWPGA